MYHGIINVYKEAGYTSHDVVAKLRGILKQKKIGHTGTLDPDAVGVLPVCLGTGTRLCDMLTDKNKEYSARLMLGVTTDTQDMTGQILTRHPVTADEEAVKAAILSFIGEYEQLPPMYSAIKINGKRLYELAREGREVRREVRKVWIDNIEILSMKLPEAELRVECSKGTYIRTLCHDIGEKLGCGGAMAALCRTRVGPFTIEEAFTLSRLQELADSGGITDVIKSVDEMLAEHPAVTVKEQFYHLLLNGNRLTIEQIRPEGVYSDGQKVRVYSHENSFFGLYAYQVEKECFQPVKMFIT